MKVNFESDIDDYQTLVEYRLDEIVDRLETLTYTQLTQIGEYVELLKKRKQYHD